VTAETDYVAHVVLQGLSPQTSYDYALRADGRLLGPPAGSVYRFRTPPDLGEANADFTALLFADQHLPNDAVARPIGAFAAALREEALFWGQLGDVAPGSPRSGVPEWKRSAHDLRRLWWRIFGEPSLPQVRFASRVPLNVATISDHEIANNFSLNWHAHAYGEAAAAESATLADRVRQYDLSLARWRNHFGAGAPAAGALGEAAAGDRGESVMGRAYAAPALYHQLRPYPFVELFVLDTTSFRGDPYQERRLHSQAAHADTTHARYSFSPQSPHHIGGDRSHGANETTESTRSWLGPTQRAALLEGLRRSRAKVLVVCAGYPLRSLKFEGSARYFEGRESGFDFPSEAAAVLGALEATGKLVLWVHGDGHVPQALRLRPNVYQLQVGTTWPVEGETGHRPRRLGSGALGTADLGGGAEILGLHQPDLVPGDLGNDVFLGGLDQFRGYLRLYFHPGQEALVSSAQHALRRLEAGRAIAIETGEKEDPAQGRAAAAVAGRVARVRTAEGLFHSRVTGYRFSEGKLTLSVADPFPGEPRDVRVLIDAEPWVEARWYDEGGEEWRHLALTLRRAPAPGNAPGR
jgi:hypothetical protein